MKKLFLSLVTIALSAIAIAADNPAMAYMAPDGAFFSGCTEKGGTYNPYVYLPYRSTYTWSSLNGAGNWTDTKHTATDATELVISNVTIARKDTIPTFTNSTLTYQYGSGVTNDKKYVVYANSAYSSMTNAQIYVSGASVKQVWKLNSATTIRTFFYNNPNDVLSVKDVYIPLTTNNNGAYGTMFPEGAQMTVSIFPATYTRKEDGTYTRSKKTPALATTTLTIDNFTPYSATAYYGALVWKLTDTLNIQGAFVIELSNYSVMGAETRLFVDKAKGVNTQYVSSSDSKTYAYAANTLISVNAMFPALYKHDTTDEINFKSEGETAEKVKICANVNPTSWKITKPDWINYDITFQSDDKFYTNRDVYLTFTAIANEGEEREGTITINNRGKELTYTVKQAAKPAPVENVKYYLNTGGSSLWNQNDAKFAAYYWGNEVSATWTSLMEEADGETDVFATEIPQNADSIIFVRLSNDAIEGNWEKVWNQTIRLYIPTDGKNMYTITGLSETEGIWSTYVKPVIPDVVYELNGGQWPSGVTPKTTIDSEYTIPIPVKTNYNFGGWFANGEFSGDALTTLTTGYKGTIYAKWNTPVVSYKDSTYYVAGNFTNWIAGMKVLPTIVKFDKDSTIEFKQVMIRTKLIDDIEVAKDTIEYGQANECAFMTRESNAWRLDGTYTVFLRTDASGDYTFSLIGETFTVTFPELKPTELESLYTQKSAKKVIINGKLFIIRDGVAYDALGTMVQ